MKNIVYVLVFISLSVLAVKYSSLAENYILGIEEKAGIRVLSFPEQANVYIDGLSVGKTPYEDKELSKGEYGLKVESEDKVWQGKVTLNSGTLTIVNRELSNHPTSSAGEVLSLEKGRGITVISTPSQADVEVGGKNFGKTPISINVGYGEHTIVVGKGNYLKRSVRAFIPENYNLTLNVDLALSEVDLSQINTPVTKETWKVVVRDTPTNFLRVREKPSVASKEIGRAIPGEELILLEEIQGWSRVRLKNDSEGYVSNQYIFKHPDNR